MFTFVPHSSVLAHLDCSLWEYEDSQKHIDKCSDRDEESDGTVYETQSSRPLETEITSAHEKEDDSRSIPEAEPQVSGGSPVISLQDKETSTITDQQLIFSPSSLDSAISSLPPNFKGSESTDTQDTDHQSTQSDSPSMLSPARISSFKFVEFEALHETNVIHRLPSSSSGDPASPFLSLPNEVFDNSSPKNSPSSPRKTSSRSRRRCILCGGLIQFADRKVANGQHWHQQCFKCATCGRFLDPGKHQEFDGQPYCKTCYTALSQTHRPIMPPQSPQEKNEIISKIKDYNIYKDNPTDSIKYKEVAGGGLVYEGVIKLYWGLRRAITLSSTDSAYKRQRGPRESLYNYVSIDDDGFSKLFENAKKNNDVMSKEDLQELMGYGSQNGVDGLVTQSLNDAALRQAGSIPEEERVGDDYLLVTHSEDDDSDMEPDYENVAPLRQSVVMRQKSDIRSNRGTATHAGLRRRSASFKKVQRQRKQAEAREQKRSQFIPPYGKPTNLRVSNIQGADEVITMLLQKFKVENPPSEFALFVMHDSGAIDVLKSTDSPLAVRLKLGPSEDVAKIYVMESSDADKIVSQEAAEYIKFQVPELNIFLKKYTEEEEKEVEKLKKRFEIWKAAVSEQIRLLES